MFLYGIFNVIEYIYCPNSNVVSFIWRKEWIKMSKCNIDHSVEDVISKYESQLPYLPQEVSQLFVQFFKENREQSLLNEAFHLLKKYDLASTEEREERNKKMLQLLSE